MIGVEPDSEQFMELLTDALRAGPGSPAWHAALQKLAAPDLPQRDEYHLLLEARQNLESGRAYREVRAGPEFTRKLLRSMDAVEGDGRGAAGSTPTIVAILAGAVALSAIVLIAWLLVTSGSRSQSHRSLAELQSMVFSHEITTSAATADWNPIGLLPVDWRGHITPPADLPSDGYSGYGIVTARPLAADVPAVLEATFRIENPHTPVVIQAFITDQPVFSPDRGTSPHELVWALEPANRQANPPTPPMQRVLRADGAFAAGEVLALHGGSTLKIRLAFDADNVVVSSDGHCIYAGEHRLSATAPRYVGIRFLCRGKSPRQVPQLISAQLMQE